MTVSSICTFAEIGRDEFFMGLDLIRWWHLRQASGDVLEVGKFVRWEWLVVSADSEVGGSMRTHLASLRSVV
jgi:hypothetical protein